MLVLICFRWCIVSSIKVDRKVVHVRLTRNYISILDVSWPLRKESVTRYTSGMDEYIHKISKSLLLKYYILEK